MFWLPASPSRYTSPSRLTIIPWSSGTRGSGRWISQLALRPMRSQSATTVFLTGARCGDFMTSWTRMGYQ